MDHTLVFALLAQIGRPPVGGADAGFMAQLVPQLIIQYGVGLVLSGIMFWGVFEKAGEPGWASVIPFFRYMVLARISDQPEWLGIVADIPLCGGIFALILFIVAGIRLAGKFDQGGGYAVGLILLGIIFYPILGYGSALYEGRGRKKRKKKKRRRVRRDEDEGEAEDEYERPRPRKRRPPDDSEEEEQEERYEEDEEESPSPRARRRPADEEDEEVEERIAPRPRQASSGARAEGGSPSRVSCPECGATLKLPPGIGSGKRIKCPKCREIFEVP
jgi:hypothetical protein